MAKKRDYPSVRRFTKKATTPKLRRQWKHVYRSSTARGLSKGEAIKRASGVTKKQARRKSKRGARRGGSHKRRC